MPKFILNLFAGTAVFGLGYAYAAFIIGGAL